MRTYDNEGGPSPVKFCSRHGATDLRVEIIVVYVERYLFGHEAHFVPPITGIQLGWQI